MGIIFQHQREKPMYWPIIIAIFLSGLMFTSTTSSASERKGKPTRSAESISKTSENIPNVATSVFEKVSKSVIIVEAQTPTGKVQGSGVVYDSDRSVVMESKRLKMPQSDELKSYVVTNAHVVKNTSDLSVVQGNKRYQADIEYRDREGDLALLRVHGDLFSTSPPFSGVQLKVGERVFAIGSPLGLENTISEGILSGKREENGVLLLQTTSPISPGSSGGGLFNGERAAYRHHNI